MDLSPALQSEIEQIATLKGISPEQFILEMLTEKIHALKQQCRTPGQYEGKLIIPEDFNDPLPPEILDVFLNPAEPRRSL